MGPAVVVALTWAVASPFNSYSDLAGPAGHTEKSAISKRNRSGGGSNYVEQSFTFFPQK